jgi:hypothetical protein
MGMTRYEEIVQAVNEELIIHRTEIERNEIDHQINLTWVELRVYLDHNNQQPVKVAFSAESIRKVNGHR